MSSYLTLIIVISIKHGANGRTLYGGFYDTLKNFVVVKGNKENTEVEGQDRQLWEDIFVYMWEMFKQGRFREATIHWDPVLQAEFLREIKSMRYLTYWLSKI